MHEWWVMSDDQKMKTFDMSDEIHTWSRIHMTPPGGQTVMKEQGTNRLTPAFFAASARGIWSSHAPGPMVLMTLSMPAKMIASWMSSLISATWILTPRSFNFKTDGLVLDAGRIRASTS
jgi:hypothetical protein